MEPQLNETWIMRNGQSIEIDRVVPEDSMPLKHGKHMCWQSNGRYWDDSFDHRLDLIEKVDELVG